MMATVNENQWLRQHSLLFFCYQIHFLIFCQSIRQVSNSLIINITNVVLRKPIKVYLIEKLVLIQ